MVTISLSGAASADLDAALLAFAVVARAHGVAVNPVELRRRLPPAGDAGASSEILRAAQICRFKARRLLRQGYARALEAPKPAILILRDGGVGVLTRGRSDVANLLIAGERIPRQLDEAALRDLWDGELILLRPEAPEGSEGVFGLRWFLSSVLRYRRPLSAVLVMSVFVQLFALITPLFFQVIIDKVLTHRSEDTLIVIAVALLVLGTFEILLQYCRTYTLNHTSSRIDVELGAKLFDRLFKLPLSYFERRPAGQTVARVRELENIRGFLTGQALTSGLDALFALIFAAVLCIYSVKLTLIILATLPLYVLVVATVRPILKQKVDERFDRGAQSQQLLVESVISAQTLKAAAVEPLVQHQWETRLARFVKAAFESTLVSLTGQNTIQYINKITLVVILYFGAHAVIDGDMTVGGLVAFNMISGQLFAPVLRLAGLWQDFQQVQVSIDRLGDILNAPAEEKSELPSDLPRIRGDITLKNVVFRYMPGSPEVLKGVSLEIPAGQVVGIVGASGSGKSTFAKLIQRMYAPERGKILIDGVDISQVHAAWFRAQMGVVLQESVLLNRTIHENIALARPEMTREDVMAVARLSGADEFIRDLPQGYDTRLDERGGNLSGGQRQRVAIARALACDPRILILDEATSALDYESERVIRRNMREIVRGRTVLIIAHRLAAVRDCDRILSFASGRVVEDGAHEVLLRRPSGVYAKLWALQTHSGDTDHAQAAI